MNTSTRLPAIRLREWVDYYADRWQVDAKDLMSETYGEDIFPTPSVLRHRISLLHQIGDYLDQLLPLGQQRLYWHIPANGEKRPPASFLAISPDSCLDVVLDELRTMSDVWAISEGTYEPGLTLTNALLAILAEDYGPNITSMDAAVIPHAVPPMTRQEISTPMRWEQRWQSWPDSIDVGQRIRGTDVRSTSASASRLAERLRTKGMLLGVRYPSEQKLRYPPCQFQGQQLLPVIEQLLSTLPPGSGSGWFKVFWLYSDNLELDGQQPADLLRSHPAKVIQAAEKVIQPSAYFGW